MHVYQQQVSELHREANSSLMKIEGEINYIHNG
jgi:hypothetical protein